MEAEEFRDSSYSQTIASKGSIELVCMRPLTGSSASSYRYLCEYSGVLRELLVGLPRASGTLSAWRARALDSAAQRSVRKIGQCAYSNPKTHHTCRNTRASGPEPATNADTVGQHS